MILLPIDCRYCGSPAKLSRTPSGGHEVSCTDQRGKGCGETGPNVDGGEAAVLKWNSQQSALGER